MSTLDYPREVRAVAETHSPHVDLQRNEHGYKPMRLGQGGVGLPHHPPPRKRVSPTLRITFHADGTRTEERR